MSDIYVNASEKISEKYVKLKDTIEEILTFREEIDGEKSGQSAINQILKDIFSSPSISKIMLFSKLMYPNYNKFKAANYCASVILDILNLIEDNNKYFEVITNINKIFLKFTENKRIVFKNNEVKIHIDDGRSVMHSFGELSSGERHLLTFIIILSLIGRNKDLIMIDEPGISLDTDWQESLTDFLIKLCPHSQIILTTHSPDIAMKNPNIIRRIRKVIY